jgi:oxalate decarboxylase/phosphoglucose isomerase-like protein (cupin superfamily)
MKHLIFFLCAIIVVSAQLESASKRRSKFSSADFVIDLAKSKPGEGAGGAARSATLDQMPVLSGEGLSLTLMNLNPCGMNMPHVHPRASEIVYVIDGEDLQVGFAEENNGRFIVNRISTGFSTIFPRGLIHYQINLSCKNATIIAALNNEDPGVISVAKQTFLFPNYVLSGTLGIPESEIDQLRDGLPKNPALSLQQSECYQRCGINAIRGNEASVETGSCGCGWKDTPGACNTPDNSACWTECCRPSNSGGINFQAGLGYMWAVGCDWNNNDMGSAEVRGEDCGGKCLNTNGCTHFTWTSFNGGTCWMKKGSVQPGSALKTDQSMVCGYKSGPGPQPGPERSGKTTRYWDCCKPSSAWDKKAPITAPVRTCQKDGVSIIGDVNAQSGCGGGPAYTCTNNAPWAINDRLAYGFAAANFKGQTENDWSCACYRLRFTSTAIAGKEMIVQVTNTGGDLGVDHFDIQIPGGGVGIFNGCSSQWGAPSNGWGDRYGGVRSINECNQLPGQLQNGCRFRFEWFQGADNPAMTFQAVQCPSELTNISGCKRR